MASNKKVALIVFSLALLVMAYGTEAVRMCYERSKEFHGRCVSDRNCGSSCHHENNGAGAGRCRRTRVRTCVGGPPPAGNYDAAGDDVGLDARRKCRWQFGPVCTCMKPCDASAPPAGGLVPPPVTIAAAGRTEQVPAAF